MALVTLANWEWFKDWDSKVRVRYKTCYKVSLDLCVFADPDPAEIRRGIISQDLGSSCLEISVVDPDPVGSVPISWPYWIWIRINLLFRIRFHRLKT